MTDGFLNMEVTPVAVKTLEAHTSGRRYIVNQGGTGSSKTISICQVLIGLAHQKQQLISVVRQTMPTLRGTAMRDFQGLLEKYGLYDPRGHNKSENIYKVGSSEVEFFGLDESQKARGRKRDILWLNEANELSWEDYLQLALRTDGAIFFDYNPSDLDHWIYDKILTDPECELIKSTYKDNFFLGPEKIKEIEKLQGGDENHWLVYGCGERGVRRTNVYTRYDYEVASMGDDVKDIVWGLDFGFSPDPTALYRIGSNDAEEDKKKRLYVEEWLYQAEMTNTDLIAHMEAIGVPKGDRMWADAADPGRIKEIEEAGFNIRPVPKGEGSVRDGIDECRRYHVHFIKNGPHDCKNGFEDWSGYGMKVDRNGKIISDKFVGRRIHACDAIRYAIHGKLKDDEGFSIAFAA